MTGVLVVAYVALICVLGEIGCEEEVREMHRKLTVVLVRFSTALGWIKRLKGHHYLARIGSVVADLNGSAEVLLGTADLNVWVLERVYRYLLRVWLRHICRLNLNNSFILISKVSVHGQRGLVQLVDGRTTDVPDVL